MKTQPSFISDCNIPVYVVVFPEMSLLIKGRGRRKKEALMKVDDLHCPPAIQQFPADHISLSLF